MTKPDDTTIPAAGSPVDRGVGRLVPERDDFLAGICVALQCATASDDGVLWREIVQTAGVESLLRYATFVEPEEWELAGFKRYAQRELHRSRPRKCVPSLKPPNRWSSGAPTGVACNEGLDMAVCTYDNPDTMARECWMDGRLVCKYAATLLLRKLRPWETQPVPPEHFFFGANIGDWNPGQMVGDASAMSNVC